MGINRMRNLHLYIQLPAILRDIMRDVSLVTEPQQQPQSQNPYQVYAYYAIYPPQLSFLFQSSTSL